MRATVILCDLDDPQDPRPGAGTVRLAIDGVEHELDVCAEHLALLRALPSVGSSTQDAATVTSTPAGKPANRRPAGRRSNTSTAASTHTPGGTRKPGSRRAKQERIAAAREWARANGREVSDRGRLPAGLFEEFEAAHA